MKKITLLLSLILAIVSIKAQNFQISFAGTGASSTVDTVKVENLTQGKNVTLSGSDVLHLVATLTGLNPMPEFEEALRIYPNPTNGNSTIEFVATSPGKTSIELFDITGKRLVSSQNTLAIGSHSFMVNGLSSGIYTLRINSQAYTYTSKLVSHSTISSGMKISYLGISAIALTANKLKSAYNEKIMQYTTGDVLKFTAKSGNYCTVFNDVPTQSKTITYSFVACSDVDGNHYPVVQIGSQFWMAENLAYLPTVSPPTLESYTAPFYYVYGYEGNSVSLAKATTNYKTYGVLYNWPAAIAACPQGWRLPSDTEWMNLEKYLIANGFNFDGTTFGNKIGKSLASTTNWESYSGPGYVGNSNNPTYRNKTGFSGLPGGLRYYNGIFSYMGRRGYWWSCTESITNSSWYRSLYYSFQEFTLSHLGDKDNGYSCRCVKD